MAGPPTREKKSEVDSGAEHGIHLRFGDIDQGRQLSDEQE